MEDKLIFCSDIEALKRKLVEDGFYDEETKSFQTGCTLTPIKKQGEKSLSLARELKLDLKEYTMLEDIGTYESILLEENKEQLDKYKSVYPYDVPVVTRDEVGNKTEHYRPFKIGVFF